MKRVYLKQPAKFLDECDFDIGKRIVKAIDKIPSGDIKKLKGMKIETYRLRVGRVRVIYIIENDTLIISKIDYRGDAYK